MMGTRLAEELCIITNVDDVDERRRSEANARTRASERQCATPIATKILVPIDVAR